MEDTSNDRDYEVTLVIYLNTNVYADNPEFTKEDAVATAFARLTECTDAGMCADVELASSYATPA